MYSSYAGGESLVLTGLLYSGQSGRVPGCASGRCRKATKLSQASTAITVACTCLHTLHGNVSCIVLGANRALLRTTLSDHVESGAAFVRVLYSA